ncbi:hypothetical protein Syun_007185 [Stephania yunnanensis]|uniref:Uncharacterized protein n=1 Tax=Stephania yunnanensis TaxID=152371 RepID=A0AAP0L1I5_9MAGN
MILVKVGLKGWVRGQLKRLESERQDNETPSRGERSWESKRKGVKSATCTECNAIVPQLAPQRPFRRSSHSSSFASGLGLHWTEISDSKEKEPPLMEELRILGFRCNEVRLCRHFGGVPAITDDHEGLEPSPLVGLGLLLYGHDLYHRFLQDWSENDFDDLVEFSHRYPFVLLLLVATATATRPPRLWSPRPPLSPQPCLNPPLCVFDEGINVKKEHKAAAIVVRSIAVQIH